MNDNTIPNIANRMDSVAPESGGLFVRSACTPGAFELNVGSKQIISYQERDSFMAQAQRYGFRPYSLGLADVTLGAPGAVAFGATNFTLPTEAQFFAIEVGNSVTIEDNGPFSSIQVNSNIYTLGPSGVIASTPLDARIAYKPRLLVFNIPLTTSGNNITLTGSGLSAGRYFSIIHLFSR